MFEKLFKSARESMRQAGMTPSEIDGAEAELRRRVDAEDPPRIALIGFTGVGKSSTVNALFNAGQAIGHVRACTQEAAEVRGDVSEYLGSKGSVIVYDMPGLGEDIAADQRHYQTYAAVLPRVDVAVWTFHAGDRAMTPMQQAILALRHQIGDGFTQKLIFAINKADAIAPGELSWNDATNSPSREQRSNLLEFEQYIAEKVRAVIPGWRDSVVSYSAKRNYHLEPLLTAMVDAAGSNRAWLLDNRADVVNQFAGVDPALLAYALERAKDLGPQGSQPWRQADI